MLRSLLAFTILANLVAAPASAEVYNCDGKWTNRPCKGKATQTLQAGDTATRVLKPGEVREQSEKRSIFHELNMRAIEARRALNVRMDITNVERTCVEDGASTADECRALADEADAKLSARIVEARQAQAVEPVGEPEVQVEDSSTNITVIENNRNNLNVVNSLQTGGDNELNVVQRGYVGSTDRRGYPQPDSSPAYGAEWSGDARSPSRLTNRPSRIRQGLTD